MRDHHTPTTEGSGRMKSKAGRESKRDYVKRTATRLAEVTGQEVRTNWSPEDVAALELPEQRTLPPHQEDVDVAHKTIRDYCAANRLTVEIGPFTPGGEAAGRILDGPARLCDDSASAHLIVSTMRLERMLAEFDRMELWSDADQFDNSWHGTALIVFNVMVCRPPFDQYNRPTYVSPDTFAAVLREM